MLDEIEVSRPLRLHDVEPKFLGGELYWRSLESKFSTPGLIWLGNDTGDLSFGRRRQFTETHRGEFRSAEKDNLQGEITATIA